MLLKRPIEISVAFDLHGCPNRCRHCWLGPGLSRSMSIDEVLTQFRTMRSLAEAGGIEGLAKVRYFSTWFREPDYGGDYRELFELEMKLNNGVNHRRDYELLSIWRLARDPGYAEWAKSTGTSKCQVTLFGLEETNDWFYRRRGAFRDVLRATEVLLAAGIHPRWQLFQTKRILAELPDLLRLVQQLRLDERVQELGGEFQLFMHDPTPIGEARRIEYLRITRQDVKLIPQEIIERTRKHMGPVCYRTEAEWIEEILGGENAPMGTGDLQDVWFYVTPSWDVYANVGSLDPWWRLGNLVEDGFPAVFEAFRNGRCLGLRAIQEVGSRQLARAYGDPMSAQVYMSKRDLLQLWLEQYCEERWS